jgi:hypothetical protein
MKLARCLLGTAILAGLWAPWAEAQTRVQPQLLQPESLRRTAFDDYDATSADQAAVTPAPAPGGEQAAADALPVVEPGVTDPDGGAGPWKIPQLYFFQRMGIDMGGWIQPAIAFNADKPADRFNGPIACDDRDREFMLNQVWLYFNRPTKTDGCGWDFGGRVDLVYGEDWRFGQNLGLEPRINGNDNFYGWVFPQFYAEVAYNDLTVKMGHYGTMTAYEKVPPVMNFFYSHTYMSCGYADPLLVTGLQAEYKLNDRLTLVGGFHRGWMMFEDLNDDLDFLGGVRWQSSDKRTGISFMIDNGAQDPAGQNNRFTYIFVLTRQLNEKLLFAFQHDYGFEQNGSVLAQGSEDAEWYGAAAWLIYTLNPCWSAGVRFEWFRDDDGSRIAGVGNLLGTSRGWLGGPGYAGNFYDLSVGLNWRPRSNVLFRPEVRWDWYDGAPSPIGPDPLPFDAGNRKDQFTFAIDLLLTF